MQKAIKITSALNILNVEPGASQAEIKESAKRLLAEYTQHNTVSSFLRALITSALESLSDYRGFKPADYEKEEGLLEKYHKALKEVEQLGLNIVVSGSWIWLDDDLNVKPIRDSLIAAGFLYHGKRRTFFFRPDYPVSRSRGNFSREDIRDTYGLSGIHEYAQNFDMEPEDEEEDSWPGEEVIEDEEE